MTLRERLRRLLVGAPAVPPRPTSHRKLTYMESGCPLPECQTCEPEPAPIDTEAARQRARDLAYTSAWLVERYPDAWYFEGTADLARFAGGILDLRLQVADGRLES